MPSITSDVSYGSIQQGTPSIEYSASAPITTIKSTQEIPLLTTMFLSAKVTDSIGAAVVIHLVLITML